MSRRYLAFWTITLFIAGAAWAQQPPSFLSYVAIGDSLTAGFISGSLNEDGQKSAFPVLLSAQMRTFMFVPMIARPGIPNELELVSTAFPPNIRSKAGTSSGRIFPLLMSTNLAVPGHTTRDALRTRPRPPITDPAVVLTNLVLGLPGLVAPIAPAGSQIEMAEFLRPTFATIWLGSNEILGPATAGNADVVPFEQFRTDYTELINRVLATGARIAVANVPDVPSAARFLSLQEVASALGIPAAVIQAAARVGPNDLLQVTGLGALGQILQGQAQGPLAPSFVLTEEEVRTIRSATSQYNDFIAALAAEKGFAVIDTFTFLQNIRREGILVGNVRLNGLYLGGIFSLDLIHPTRTAQAIIANLFIAAINSFYKTNLAPVDVAAILVTDNLVIASRLESSKLELTLEDIQTLTAEFSEQPDGRTFDWNALVSAMR